VAFEVAVDIRGGGSPLGLLRVESSVGTQRSSDRFGHQFLDLDFLALTCCHFGGPSFPRQRRHQHGFGTGRIDSHRKLRYFTDRHRELWARTHLGQKTKMIIFAEIILAVLALLWTIGTFVVWKTQNENIFPGDGAVFGEHPEVLAMGGTTERASRDGQDLRWYWIEAKNPKAILLLFHGNRDGAFERLDFAKALVPQNVSVALAEYPGYGGEAGPTNEWAVLRNALAIYDEIETRCGTLPVFLMGESLGTGPATYVSSLRRPRGLLLSTPYTSMASVAKFRYPWMPIHTLIRHPIKAMYWAPHVHCPVLVLHGTLDKTVPYSLGQAEAKLFRHLEHFEIVEGAGHSNLREVNQGQFWMACIKFIQAHCE
jgi:alpha-beta hydrolase superfamily lysophospholipase